MKKFLILGIGVAVLAMGLFLNLSAQAVTTNVTVTTPTFDSACMQSATTARDNALISAVGAYSTAVTSALTARRDGLNTAWGNTDTKARNTALKTVMKTYAKSLTSARTTFQKSKGRCLEDVYNHGAKNLQDFLWIGYVRRRCHSLKVLCSRMYIKLITI